VESFSSASDDEVNEWGCRMTGIRWQGG